MMRSIKSLGELTGERGMDESTWNIWISTLHNFTAVEETMRQVTKTTRQNSQQHVELGPSRRMRDFEDLIKFYTWLKQFNFCKVRDNWLRSLNSGLAASDSSSVNCDEAAKVGRNMLVCMDNKSVAEAKVETSKKVKTLLTLTKAVQLENTRIHVNPSILFLRLMVLIERTDDTEKWFGYELTPYRTALFKDNIMRHPNKAALAEAILNYKKISKIKQKRKGDEDTNGDPKRSKRKPRKVESNVEESNDLSPEANLNSEMRQETKVKYHVTTDGEGTEKERI